MLRAHAPDVALFGNDGDQLRFVAQVPVTINHLGRFLVRMNDKMSARFTVIEIQQQGLVGELIRSPLHAPASDRKSWPNSAELGS